MHNELRQNTMQFDQLIKRRRQILENIIDEGREALDSLPQGKLRISQKGKYAAYYLRENEKDKNGRYIARENEALIRDLSQREYLEKLMPAAEKELRRLQGMKLGDAESAYDAIKEEKRSFIEPLYLPDDEFVCEWENVEYSGKQLAESDDGGFLTMTGVRVRSKSELIIADRLTKFSIPYRYEYPIKIKGRIFYPDFTCLNVRLRRIVIFEHFGMMGDPEYMSGALRKLSFYEENGLKLGVDLIFTMESDTNPLDIRHLEALIKNHLL